MSRYIQTLVVIAATAGLLLIGGCATTREQHPNPLLDMPTTQADAMIIVGSDNTAIPWETLVEQAAGADIVVLGEQHDDPFAHRVQAALIEALAAREKVAVCMEMFERDEQPIVDAFLAGTISQESLVEATDSRDWGAEGAWDSFYQPIVDAAKKHGSPVIAANAPRRFVRLARTEAFDGLAAFTPAYPGHFVVPAPIEQTAYAERFKETMRSHAAPQAAAKKRGGKSKPSVMPAMTEETLEAMFRAQQVWDATMAEATVRACREHGKALLLVGQFHTDHGGGLLLRMKAAAPELEYLTISIQKATGVALRQEDYDRADYVVFRPVAAESTDESD